MKTLVIVLVALTLFMACEAPVPEQNEENMSYRGRSVETVPAPFLVQNGLAKDGKDGVVISESSADATVYGALADETVYLAVGGEELLQGTWIGSLSNEPIEVTVGKSLNIVFETLTEVTIIDADNISYIDVDGQSVLFSGSGVLTTTEISTGIDGSVTLISTVQFSIGDEGVDAQ